MNQLIAGLGRTERALLSIKRILEHSAPVPDPSADRLFDCFASLLDAWAPNLDGSGSRLAVISDRDHNILRASRSFRARFTETNAPGSEPGLLARDTRERTQPLVLAEGFNSFSGPERKEQL